MGENSSPETPLGITGVSTTKNKEKEDKKMIIIVDTLEFAVKDMTVNDLLFFLGIENLPFSYSGKFRFNYNSSLYSGGIIIGYDNFSSEYSCYVSMSGKGCRTFESHLGGSHVFDWYNFLLQLYNIDVSFRRIDIACDVYDNSINIKRCLKYYESNKFASKSSRVVGYCFSQEEFLVGAPSSNMLVRIYNKALERGYSDGLKDGKPWVRCEMQLRDEYASQFVQEYLLSLDIGLVYKLHLSGFMRFLVSANDKRNSQRIPSAPWWDRYIDSLPGVRFASAPGVEYNYKKSYRFVKNQAASSVKFLALYNKWSPQRLYEFFMRNDDVKLNNDHLSYLKSRLSEEDYEKILPFLEGENHE